MTLSEQERGNIRAHYAFNNITLEQLCQQLYLSSNGKEKLFIVLERLEYSFGYNPEEFSARWGIAHIADIFAQIEQNSPKNSHDIFFEDLSKELPRIFSKGLALTRTSNLIIQTASDESKAIPALTQMGNVWGEIFEEMRVVAKTTYERLERDANQQKFFKKIMDFANHFYDWSTARYILVRNPDLVSDEALATLSQMIEHVQGKNDEISVEFLTNVFNMLQTSRNANPEKAFTYQVNGSFFYDLIVHNTISAIFSRKLLPWSKTIQWLIEQARFEQNQQHLILFGAIAQLFSGSPPSSIIVTELTGSSMECWNRIYLECTNPPIENPSELDQIIREFMALRPTISNLPRRITLCRKAIQLIDNEKNSEQWAAFHMSLGTSLIESQVEQRADNIDEAIGCFHKALEVFNKKEYLQQWSNLQTNLGFAYLRRIKGSRTLNIEQAIVHTTNALEVTKKQEDPFTWGTLKINLGECYRSRLKGEQTDNLNKAIENLNVAFEVINRDTYPARWAAIHINLSTIINESAISEPGNRRADYSSAEWHLEQALEELNADDSPDAWAMAMQNLGLLYTNNDPEKAIKCFDELLSNISEQTHLTSWVLAQFGLAQAYSGWRENSGESSEKSIEIYHQVLKRITIDSDPINWAVAHSWLAQEYLYSANDIKTLNSKKILHHSNEALKVRTAEEFPHQHRKIYYNLGNLHFALSDWSAAFQAYAHAIETGEALISSAYTEKGRNWEVYETSRWYPRAAYCLIKLERFSEALEYIERGKIRILSEALAINDLDIDQIKDVEQREKLRITRQTIKALEAELRLSEFDYKDPQIQQNLVKELAHARSTLNELYNANPIIKFHSLDFRSILNSIPPNGALIAPVFTAHGSAMFVIPAGTTDLEKGNVIELDFAVRDLYLMLGGHDHYLLDWKTGWIDHYKFTRGNWDESLSHIGMTQWKDTVLDVTHKLWDNLLQSIDSRLKELGVKEVIFLPQGGLQLLPLHAAWREVNGNIRYFCEDYTVSYVPSVHILRNANERLNPQDKHTASLFGVSEYQQYLPLPNVDKELRFLSALFEVEPLLNDKVTKETVSAQTSNKTYVHIGCHALFGWNGNPLLGTGLILAKDEKFSLAEIISQLDLNEARLVILSACETGIIDMREPPDEHISLSAGFIQCGTLGVISSLWAVNDNSTRLLMEQFYNNHIKLNMSPAKALQSAQIWLMKATRGEIAQYILSSDFFLSPSEIRSEIEHILRGDPNEKLYGHPHYWAPFTLTGI